MLIFAGESSDVGVGFDFLYLGLESGRVVTKFNNGGGLEIFTTSTISNTSVNDSEVHRLQFVFLSGTAYTLVDNSERVTLFNGMSYTQHNNHDIDFIDIIATLSYYYNLSLVFSLSMDHPPDVWLGGVPSNFIPPQHSSLNFSSFRGCLSNFAYSTEEENPIFINPVNSTAHELAVTRVIRDVYFLLLASASPHTHTCTQICNTGCLCARKHMPSSL